ncbi:MAG TPA: RIP metalloprotease RseP [Candidatus Cybelea sp.]|nr:RIP metalloprotease RseP [Candidatus Cybelea sp.]
MAFISQSLIYMASFLVVLTAIVFVHEWGHFIVARLNGVRVEVFSIGFGRELYGWDDRHGTRWKIGMLPFGGYVKFFGDANAASMPGKAPDLTPAERAVAFHYKSVARRAAVVFAGPAANFIFAVLVYAALFSTVGQPFTPPVIGEVAPGSVAAAAGLKAGDRILAIDGHAIERFQELRSRVVLSADTPISITFRRDGREQTIEVTPRRVEQADGVGGKAKVGQIGIKAVQELDFVRHDPISAVYYGVRETEDVVRTTMTYLGRFIEGQESGDSIGGMLSIAKMSGDVAQVSLAALVSLIATFSISIGLINLFPIPVLDGGHLLFYAVEAVRGRPLGERAQEYGFRLGLVLVLTIFVFATWQDLVRLRIVSYLAGLFS